MTFYFPAKKTVPFTLNPLDGVYETYKRYDDKETYTIDFTDYLSNDTISSVVWSSDGPTLSSESNTTTAVTLTVLYTGEADCTLTLASGDIKEIRFRWLGINSSNYNDYGN